MKIDTTRDRYDLFTRFSESREFLGQISMTQDNYIKTIQSVDYDLWLTERTIRKMEVREIESSFSYVSHVKIMDLTALEGLLEPEEYSIIEVNGSFDGKLKPVKMVIHKDYDLLSLKKANWIAGGEFLDDSSQALFFLCKLGYDPSREEDYWHPKRPFFLISSGLETEEGKDLLKNSLHPRWGERILIITFNISANESLINAAQDIGFAKEDIFICNDIYTCKKIVKDKLVFENIYIGNGEPSHYMEKLKESGLAEHIRYLVEQQKTRYIGSGAGVDILGKNPSFLKNDTCGVSERQTPETLNLFDGVIIPNFSLRNLVRLCYEKNFDILNHYDVIGFIKNESMLKYDTEKTIDLKYAYFKDTRNYNGLELFLELTKNHNDSTVIVCDSDSIAEYSAGDIEIKSQRNDLGQDDSVFRIHKNEYITVTPAYCFFCHESYFAFRLFSQQGNYIDIVFCFNGED